jgi:cysteine desulfurase/selenocysteine lyase
MGYSVDAVRQDFAPLRNKNPPLYFDNACMTLRPPQLIAERKGLTLDVVHSRDDNTLAMDTFRDKLAMYSSRVAMVAMGQTSNLDGVTVPARHRQVRASAKVLLDAAQSVPHQEINARTLDVDYLAFSGHKMLGPSGIGVLYGRV